MKRVLLFLSIAFILWLPSCGENRQKFFVELKNETNIEPPDLQHEKRDFATILENDEVRISYKIFHLFDKWHSYAEYGFRKKIKEDVIVHKFVLNHIFKGQILSNTHYYKVEERPESDVYVNPVPPFTLNNKKKRVFFKFSSSLLYNDVQVKDRMEVYVEVEYEIAGKRKFFTNTIHLVVQLRKMPITLL